MKPLALIAAFGIILGALCWNHTALNARADAHRSRIERLEQRRVTIDLSPVYDRIRGGEERIEQCEARLADVRHVLNVLVREDRWPSREVLPRPVSDWKEWPVRGEAIGSINQPNRCGWPSRPCARRRK